MRNNLLINELGSNKVEKTHLVFNISDLMKISKEKVIEFNEYKNE